MMKDETTFTLHVIRSWNDDDDQQQITKQKKKFHATPFSLLPS